MDRLLVIILLILISNSYLLVQVLASPVLNTTSCSRKNPYSRAERVHILEAPYHDSTSSEQHVETVVQVETWRIVLPSTPATLTEFVAKSTNFPKPIALLSVLHSKSKASSAISATTPTPFSSRYSTSVTTSIMTSIVTSSVVLIVSSNSVSAHPVVTGLANAPPTSRLPASTALTTATGLSVGTLIAVSIVASVAASVFAVTLWALMRASCSKRARIIDSEGKGALGFDTQEKGNEVGSPRDVAEVPREEIGGSFSPGIIPPAHLETRRLSQKSTPSARARRPPLPFSFSSFLSSASSWTPEQARSQALDVPRPFTTFDLSTPVNPHPGSIEHIEHSRPTEAGKEDNTNNSKADSSPEAEDNKRLTFPSLRGSCGVSSRDPRSPRRISIPLFMENYMSPSLPQYLPSESRATALTLSARDSYSVDGDSVPPSLSHGETEGQIGVGPEDPSASMVSLPSVSSEVMTPRRHWTFVDIHGPSVPATNNTRNHDNGNTHDRLSETESSRTLAVHAPRPSVDHFASANPGVHLSEPLSADSFLHSDFESSTSSGYTQYRSANSESLGHSRRTF